MNAQPVGIVTALSSEARALADRAVPPGQCTPLRDGGLLYLSGMGPPAARRGALALLDAGAKALVAFGVAGALAPGLRNGTLFCPSLVIDAQGRDYQPSPAWHTTLGAQLAGTQWPVLTHGILLSADTPVLGAHEKTAMRDRHMAVAVDMESAAVAAVATEHGLPFIVLRAIVDEHHDDVPAALQAGIDTWGRPRPMALLAALGRHPGLLASLPGLATRMGKATRALRDAAGAAGHQLGHEPSGPC
ncbi:purine and other phosphorylase-like protein, family 1 [Dyella sp. C9]|uniref:phosphorylase family protein n=1 Tax=Dyella sp. C9 TaxID=2202154 RepID=UPI0018E50FB9|nr:purine and other phosphorylase-like protein, family 1 [Dyella sp. C9]